jgi:hypothetical protein
MEVNLPDLNNATTWLFISGTAFGGWLGYWVFLGVWRLTLDPIAKSPGPKLAAASFMYEFYYDINLSGQYTFKIKEISREIWSQSPLTDTGLKLTASRANRPH